MATRVWESAVIDGPIDAVWALVRPLDFSYLGTVASAAVEGKLGPNEVGSVHVITYKDKTVQKLKVTELSDAKHSVSWDLIESNPPHHVLSASYSIRLRHITQGNLTFVEWVVDFSKDVTPVVSADAGFKARENFKALAGIVKAKLLADGVNAKIGKDKVSVPQLKRQLSANSAQLHKLFTQLDKNGNGVLEFDEFALAVNKLRGENLPDEVVKLLLREADTNHDNVVSYEEFTRFLASEHLEAKARDILHAPELKLLYFNARGRGEIPRLICAEAGIKYEDARYDFKTWSEQHKAKSPFGQMPLLLVGGKTMIAQSAAIVRYLAKLGGLYGKTLEEAARIDMIGECFSGELGNVFSAAWYDKDAKAKEEKINKFWNETFPQWTGLLEKQLVGNAKGHGWFVGNNITVADITAFHELGRYLALKKECLNACPNLHQLVTRVGNRPNIADWVKKRPPTEF